MTTPSPLSIVKTDLDALAGAEGRVVVLVGPEGKLDQAGRRANRLTRGALARLVESEGFAKLKPGEARELAWPAGMAAEAVQAVRLDARGDRATARKAGVAIGKAARGKPVLVLAGSVRNAEEIGLGARLGAYAFTDHKTEEEAREKAGLPALTLMVSRPEEVEAAARDHGAVADGVFFARDLVNEPSNVLTTTEFAARLEGLRESGLEVEVLDEAELERQGMRLLLAVGQGSESPSKVVVMRWNGGGEEAPVALVGKGVVFDTGGISIKPGQGMEEMTMDMGGAGTVAGVMKTLAARKAKANVVGLVGLVENMPDGRAYRPGDVVRSMKGDTVEVINTDAEGRLVLADVMWYAQERFKPTAMVDLATLTGAILVALGHENAGVFSNDDTFCEALLAAAKGEGEGAWRMPLGGRYPEALKSRVADVKNVGGRMAGAVTAAEFLKRFVAEGTPWAHIDIAGTASLPEAGPFGPTGATGWGVMALNRLIADRYEG